MKDPRPWSLPANGPFPRLFLWSFLMLLPALACNAPQLASEEPSKPEEVLSLAEEDSGMTLEEALTLEPDDQRPRLIELMGPPDTFRLTFQELEGTVVRWEEWAYYDFGARFDFVDGQLLWTVELEPAPDMAIYPHFYDPREFTAYMSADQAKDLLADQDLVVMDLAEADLPEGLFLGADQLMLGFDQDRLVYAESLYLTPEVQQ